MLSIAFIMALAGGDAVAEAGSAYRQAKEALDAEQYEQAVQLLRGAIQQVGEENDQLKYRDDVSRRRHSYYPYYEWGRARLLQSRLEASIYTQRDLLQDAVGRLGQSRHADASVKLEEAKAKLEEVSEAIALDGSFNAAKTKIEVLGTNERYVEAYREHKAAAAKYKTRVKELDEVLGVLKVKQATTIQKYETQLRLRLNDLLLTDPLTRGETIAPMIKSVMIPEEVTEKPGPSFEWADRFMKLWEKQADTLKKAATLPGSAVAAAADSFDAAGLDALSIGLPNGFRAARHLAQTTRTLKLKDVVAGNEDVVDTKTADLVLASARAASKKGLAAAGQQADPATKDTLQNDLNAQEKQINDLAAAIAAGAKERERLTGPIVAAEGDLLDGDTLGDVDKLAKLQNDVYLLESETNFSTLTPRLKSRALFAKAMAAAMQVFLEGGKEIEAIEKARVSATRAFGFDAKADERWKDRLSPKLQTLFNKFKPEQGK